MNEDSDKSDLPAAGDNDGAMMYVACSRCRKILDIKPGNLGSITHSLCPACYKITLQEIEDFRKKERDSQ